MLLGAFFLFSAGLGMLRMPDAYTRIQAGTKASTLGNMLVLAGLAVLHPGWSLKLVIIVYFVLTTNPISSHALARAAHAIRIPMTGRHDDRRGSRCRDCETGRVHDPPCSECVGRWLARRVARGTGARAHRTAGVAIAGDRTTSRWRRNNLPRPTSLQGFC